MLTEYSCTVAEQIIAGVVQDKNQEEPAQHTVRPLIFRIVDKILYQLLAGTRWFPVFSKL